MEKISKIGDDSITLFDGAKTFTKKEIENKLIERLVLKRQNEHLKTKMGGEL